MENNYIVSARKYRPATFNTVVGQGHITSTLKNAIERGKLAHAYLFCGPRGVGKTTCARIFAKAINCMSPVDNEACQQCESCKAFNEGRSFTIHELDAASNNSVDDIRNLTDQVRIPPQIGKYSVYIIDEVHMLSSSAFNAFLKTLEEPPAHAVFILATTEKHKIIPTILSRCQIFDFNRIKVEDGVEYLKYIAGQENVTYDEESLHLISQKADGGMRDALSMFDKCVSFCGQQLSLGEVAKTLNILDFDTYIKAVNLLITGDYHNSLLLFDEVLKQGFSPSIYTNGLNAHFRDLLMARDQATRGLLELSGTIAQKFVEQASRCNVSFIFNAMKELTEVEGHLRTASNQRLNVELALLKLCEMAKGEIFSGGTSSEPATVDEKKKPEPIEPAAKAEQNKPEQRDSQTSVPEPVQGQQQARHDKPVVTEVLREDTYTTSGSDNAVNICSVESEKEIGGIEERVTDPEHTDNQAEAPVKAAATEVNIGKIRKTESDKYGFASITGRPLTELMNMDPSSVEPDDQEGEEAVVERVYDPAFSEKLNTHKNKFISDLSRERPRLAAVFNDMSVSDGSIDVVVPTQALYEELMRNRPEIADLIRDTAGISGHIEINITIRETADRIKPIKSEDKLKYLAELNPGVLLLKKRLDLELE